MSTLGDLPLPWPVEINLSKSAMRYLIEAVRNCPNVYISGIKFDLPLSCELDNFRNLLQNLLDRLEPEPGNFDLIGE